MGWVGGGWLAIFKRVGCCPLSLTRSQCGTGFILPRMTEVRNLENRTLSMLGVLTCRVKLRIACFTTTRTAMRTCSHKSEMPNYARQSRPHGQQRYGTTRHIFRIWRKVSLTVLYGVKSSVHWFLLGADPPIASRKDGRNNTQHSDSLCNG